jgi:hypothetical protein
VPTVGDPIQLSKEQREALGHEVLDLVMCLEAENEDLITDKPIHREWYNATPDVTIKHSPWYGASNLVVPLIRSMADSLIARAVLTTFSTNKLWTGSSENNFYRDRLNNWFRFLNYGARHGFDCFQPIHDLVTETYIHGSGLVQQVWEDNQREVVAPNAKSPTTVSLGRGPKIRFWPSEYALYDRELPIAENEIIVLQNNMSWGQLTRQARLSRWDEEAVASVQDQQGLEGSAAQVRELKRERLGLSETRDIRLEPHDIREVWLDWPLFKSLSTRFEDVKEVTVGEHSKKTITVPIVVTLHRKTAAVLHARYNPYLLPEWPFYETRYRNNDSRGLAKILEHYQRGLSTLVNQSIDAVTMGNSVKFITRDQTLRTQPFVPNQPLFTSDIEGIRELTGQKQVFPEMALSNLLQAGAERVSGQGDPNFGRETRMGGHPQPATNFLGQQANSQILNTLPMKSLRMAVGKMGEHRSIMYQQFEKNRGGWLVEVFDLDDAVQIAEVLESKLVVTGNIRFDVHALSEMHNPDAERQKTVLIDQVFTNYVTQVAKMLEVIENPQAQQMPMLRDHLTRAISAKGETLTRFLEASDVDNIEDYIFQLKEAQGGDINNLRQLASQVGTAAPGGGGPEGAAVGPGGAIPGPGLAAIPGGAGEGEAPLAGPGANDLLFGA